MYYVYVLQDTADSESFYIGRTADLRRRLAEHNAGRSRYTAGGVWRVAYYEAYLTAQGARKRERSLKNDGRVRRFLMERIRASLE